MELLYFILAAYGLTQILVYGSIFNGWRPTEGKLGELFKCPMCMGFWVGGLCSYFVFASIIFNCNLLWNLRGLWMIIIKMSVKL